MNLNEIIDEKKIAKKNLRAFLNSPRNKKKKETIFQLDVKSINKVLGGGFRKGSIYLFYGANRTGKTQLCHQICVQNYKIYLNISNEAPAEKSLYFDTENTFRPERIKQLSEYRKVNYEEVLRNIIISKIISNNALLLSLNSAEKQIKQKSISLLIFDSINNHYRSEIGSEDFTFSKVRDDFLKILEKIYMLTKRYNLISIITSQITPNFTEDSILEEIPVGLRYLNHFITEEIYLKKKENNQCYIHLVNSHHLPEKRLLFQISDQGISDYKI